MKVEHPYGSNAVRLEARHWCAVIVAALVLGALIPRVWQWVDPFEPGPDYRLPYRISDDYWTYERWCETAVKTYPVAIVGDSVIWGQYVAPNETLSHYLNVLEGKAAYANLGMDGAHPAALAGLVRYYAGPVRNTDVIVNWNPLWMTSSRHDLQDDEDMRINHPDLLPQVVPNLRAYNPSFATVVSVVGQRYLTFFAWMNHIRVACFDHMDLKEWTVDHPYDLPTSMVALKTPLPAQEAKEAPIDWAERGIQPQDFPWPSLEGSFQWRSFQAMVRALQSRNNRVFVIVGPFNPYVMTPESLKRYAGVKTECVQWLEEEGIAHHVASDLPSEQYADSSHPLKGGYEALAFELTQSPSFRQWRE